MALESPLEGLPPRATDVASTPDNGRRPGVAGPPVFSPTARTGRPLGGPKVRGADGLGVAEAARTGVPSDPGRAIRKPIVAPAKTASRSQQAVRRGTR